MNECWKLYSQKKTNDYPDGERLANILKCVGWNGKWKTQNDALKLKVKFKLIAGNRKPTGQNGGNQSDAPLEHASRRFEHIEQNWKKKLWPRRRETAKGMNVCTNVNTFRRRRKSVTEKIATIMWLCFLKRQRTERKKVKKMVQRWTGSSEERV